jgi:hypothetical protein
MRVTREARREPVNVSFTGRMVDLSAVLAQHQRTEKAARRKLRPAIRITGSDAVDMEAEAISEALDSATAEETGPPCIRVPSFPARMDW